MVSYTKSVHNNETLVIIEEIARRKGNGYEILTSSESLKTFNNTLYEKLCNIITNAILETFEYIE